MAALNDYITLRYNNWLDYAKHMARVHRFEGWADDLLNDVLADLLTKDKKMLNGLLNRKTQKIVNGQPTTELDKFVLKMIQMNAFSAVAPFRKNTLGNKIINRSGDQVETAQHVELSKDDSPDATTYNHEFKNRLDDMHTRNMSKLRKNGFSAKAVELYYQRFVSNRQLSDFNDIQQADIERLERYLTNKKISLFDD